MYLKFCGKEKVLKSKSCATSWKRLASFVNNNEQLDAAIKLKLDLIAKKI